MAEIDKAEIDCDFFGIARPGLPLVSVVRHEIDHPVGWYLDGLLILFKPPSLRGRGGRGRKQPFGRSRSRTHAKIRFTNLGELWLLRSGPG
jgi:hypothetical protein